MFRIFKIFFPDFKRKFDFTLDNVYKYFFKYQSTFKERKTKNSYVFLSQIMHILYRIIYS